MLGDEQSGHIREVGIELYQQMLTAAGGAINSVTTFAAELAGDFTSEAGGATLGLMYENLGG